MSLNTIFKKATSILRLSSNEEPQSQHEDGDIVFCKNNVCVHTPSNKRNDGNSIHHAGYMVVKCISSNTNKKSLKLSWIPNDRLKKNSDLLSSTVSGFELPMRSFSTESKSQNSKDNDQSLVEEIVPHKNSVEDSRELSSGIECTKSENSLEVKVIGSIEEGSTSGVYSSDEISDISPLQMDVHNFNNEEDGLDISSVEKNNRYVSSSSDSSSEIEPATGLTIAESSECSYQIGEVISEDDISLASSTDLAMSPPPRYFSSKARDQWYDRSAESMAYSANLAFPDSPAVLSLCATPREGSSPIRRTHKCGIFSVDLGQMKSLRLFFSDDEKTCGQLVVASPESQYKILHFHHGGLDKLAHVFEEWNFLVGPTNCSEKEETSSLKQFSICRPKITETELHPEENQYPYLDAETWLTFFSETGTIEDDVSLRRAIFFGGVEPQLRVNVWPFLLYYYDYRTTFEQRQTIMEEKHRMYDLIDVARRAIDGDELADFRKTVQCTVEKDVVRTDRSNPCFAGPDNPNLEKMKNILLNFAFYNPDIGYTQGMSDIVAPILSEVRNEADVFWCFVGMMSKTIFVTSPRDQDMEKNLNYLRELMKMMASEFFDYISQHPDGTDLLFCHRWILLCFKREFKENEALALWEACWSNYQTDYFHLFLVVAIVSIYGNEVLQQEMRPDETLLYFTSLALHMDGALVLKKGRGLLHQFRSKSRIPCSLVGLCELCGPGMWDSGHAPTVVCSGHDEGPVPCMLSQSIDVPRKQTNLPDYQSTIQITE